MRVDLQSIVLPKRNIFEQQVEFHCYESRRSINNIRRWDESTCPVGRDAKLNRVILFILLRRNTSRWDFFFRESAVQLFPDRRYFYYSLLLTRPFYAKREEGTRWHVTRGEDAVVPRRNPSGFANLHLTRRQMSAQPELSLYASRSAPSRSCISLSLPWFRSEIALLFYSNSISWNNKARDPYSAKENHDGPSIFRALRGDSKLMQREVSDDFDNWQ